MIIVILTKEKLKSDRKCLPSQGKDNKLQTSEKFLFTNSACKTRHISSSTPTPCGLLDAVLRNPKHPKPRSIKPMMGNVLRMNCKPSQFHKLIYMQLNTMIINTFLKKSNLTFDL